MPPLPVVAPRSALRALERTGFCVHHTTGSHHILKHPVRSELRVSLPLHRKDLKRGNLANIIKQAGLTTDEFVELL